MVRLLLIFKDWVCSAELRNSYYCCAMLLVDTYKPDWPIVHANSGWLSCSFPVVCHALGLSAFCRSALLLVDTSEPDWPIVHANSSIVHSLFSAVSYITLQCCAVGGHLKARLADCACQQRLAAPVGSVCTVQQCFIQQQEQLQQQQRQGRGGWQQQHEQRQQA
jgi:hypothetical protein